MMKRSLTLTGIAIACSLAGAYAQTAQERAAITKNYDQALLARMAGQSELKAKADKTAAEAYARQHNIPIFIKDKEGNVVSELMRIDEGNIPIYYTTKNVNAARSTRANHLNTGGSLGLNLDGQNMTVGVWDGGAVRAAHQEFGGRVTIKDGANANGNFHATHVGGTIAASGVVASAKGMAGNALLDSYDWNSDNAEMTTAAAQGLLLSNHSYGYNPAFISSWYHGAYDGEAAAWDNILFNTPYYTICKAAGNDGTVTFPNTLGGSSSAYDKLTDGATAKNTIVVASCQDAVVNSSGVLTSPVVISSFSSQGPTDDLRVKPDITANGYELYSTYNTSNTAYANMSGTSMATPNASGTLILVQQHYKNVTGGFMLGAALKGLALHTADEVGAVGPDANSGWGLLNAKRMVETINNRNTTAMLSDRTLSNNGRDSIVVTSDGINPLTVSISWYDRAGAIQTAGQENNTAIKRLVNNLDVRVRGLGNNTVYLPWVLTSRSTNAKADNNNDNFERVDAGVVPAGQYAIIVSHKGTLTGGSQNYTLIVTGKSNGVVATCTAPGSLVATNITTTGATLSWTASASVNTGYTAEYKAAAATQWLSAGNTTATSIALNGLTAATAYNFRVRTICSPTSSSADASGAFTTASEPGTSCTLAYEPNGTLATAYTIAVNTDYQAAIATNGDQDYFKITLPGGNHTVSLTNLVFDVDLQIRNSAGQTLAVSQNGGNASEQITGSFAAGTYYIRVYPYQSNTAAANCYTLKVANSSGNAPGGTLGILGLPVAENASPISVYPNPASSMLQVKISDKMARDAQIKIYDLSGKELLRQQSTGTENQVDISGLPAGLYLVFVVSGSDKYQVKFVKK